MLQHAQLPSGYNPKQTPDTVSVSVSNAGFQFPEATLVVSHMTKEGREHEQVSHFNSFLGVAHINAHYSNLFGRRELMEEEIVYRGI